MLRSSFTIRVGPADLISSTLINVIMRPTLIEMIDPVPIYKEKLILSNLNYYESTHLRIYRSNIRNKYPLLRVT